MRASGLSTMQPREAGLKLVNVRITNYRSVEDSEASAAEPDVTCLVGKNESGKTNVLQAAAADQRAAHLGKHR